jgi:hypothetical protein
MPRISDITALVFIFTLASCSLRRNDSGEPVARVGDKVLYFSQVRHMVPDGIDKADSILFAEDYIKKWVQKELVILKAEENLSPEQKDVTQELEEYRNSLILYKYEKEMVSQKMDTTVNDAEVRQYYIGNLETFILSKNIVRAAVIKIPAKNARPEQIKLLCQDETDLNFRDLREYCSQNAKSFDLYYPNWIDFDLILNNIPSTVDNQEEFLPKKKMLEARDNNYYYLIYIYDYYLKGQQAPVEYYTSQIKSLILNKRKMEFLKKVEGDIYNEGVRNKKFELYNVK